MPDSHVSTYIRAVLDPEKITTLINIVSSYALSVQHRQLSSLRTAI